MSDTNDIMKFVDAHTRQAIKDVDRGVSSCAGGEASNLTHDAVRERVATIVRERDDVTAQLNTVRAALHDIAEALSDSRQEAASCVALCEWLPEEARMIRRQRKEYMLERTHAVREVKSLREEHDRLRAEVEQAKAALALAHQSTRHDGEHDTPDDMAQCIASRYMSMRIECSSAESSRDGWQAEAERLRAEVERMRPVVEAAWAYWNTEEGSSGAVVDALHACDEAAK